MKMYWGPWALITLGILLFGVGILTFNKEADLKGVIAGTGLMIFLEIVCFFLIWKMRIDLRKKNRELKGKMG